MTHAIEFGDRLLRYGVLTPEAMAEALQRQRDVGGRLGSHLLDMGVISRFTLTNLLNRQHGYPLLRVGEEMTVNRNIAAMFPKQLAVRYHLAPITSLPKAFVVGAMDPPSARAVAEVERTMNKPVHVRILPEAIYHQIRRDYLQIATDYFDHHEDPGAFEEKPFQEGRDLPPGRELILFEVAEITLAFFRRRKDSAAERVGDMLLEDNIVDESELRASIARHPDLHVGEALMEDNLVDARLLSRYLSRHSNCATIDPYHPVNIAPDILKLIHPGTARKMLIVPLAIYEGNLLLLTTNPDSAQIAQIAARESGYQIKPVVTPRANIRWLLTRFYPRKG